MKKLILFMVFSILCLALPEFPAFAGEYDLQVGTYSGTWCNYAAKFHIESREGTDWIFRGHILIKKTGQYDNLWIEQYQDNSLRMIRYLTGAHSGQTQVVQTYPPEKKLIRGSYRLVFTGKAGYGIGCGGTSTTLFTSAP